MLIVDDCSTDGSVRDSPERSRTAIRGCASSSTRSNRGHIRTYNDGLALARGEYVVLLSADDVLTHGSLARSTALLERHPDVGLVYGYPLDFSGEPREARTRVSSWSTWHGEEWLRRVCVRGRNIIVNPEAVIRRSLLDDLGGYDPDHPHAADMKLWMEAAIRSDVGRVNGAVQAQYREHDANMHSTTFAGVLTDLRESLRAFESVFAQDELDQPTAAEFERTARKALAREAMLLAGLDQACADDGEPAAGADLAAYAAECWPGVTRTAMWRTYERRCRVGLRPAERVIVKGAHTGRWKIRWRRWRRFGT